MNRNRILWLAVIVSTAGYAAIAYYGAGRPDVGLRRHLLLPLPVALYAMALVTYIAAFLSSASNQWTRDQALVIRLALLDAVCIFGLIAAFAAHDWRLYLPAWVLGSVGLLRSFPLASPASAGPVSRD